MKRKIVHVSVQNLKLYGLDRYIGEGSGANTWIHNETIFGIGVFFTTVGMGKD